MLCLQIKEDLLGILEDLEPESIDTAGLLIEAMSSVTNNVEELSSEAQVCQTCRAYNSWLEIRSLCLALDSSLRKGSYQMTGDAMVQSISHAASQPFSDISVGFFYIINLLQSLFNF